MHIKELKIPELIKSYCIEKRQLSDCINKWDFENKSEHGYIYACTPYSGVQMWANDVFMQNIPTESMEQYHYIKINYCSQGRCEVALSEEKFVYLESGLVSVDSNAPLNMFVYPKKRYEGLEIIFDLNVFNESSPQAFSDFGIDILELKDKLKPLNGSYLATVSKEWQTEAERAIKMLKEASFKIEDYRFIFIRLMYLLINGHTMPLEQKYYITKGQRAIATDVEARISRDLRKHYTVEDLAGNYGISPSSLKKYFEQVYGTAISRYIRGKRMELACRLLTETNDSIAYIAAECGYGNQGKFGAAFKRHTGNTPLEYRRLQFERRSKQ